MRAPLALTLSLLLVCAPAMAANGWALSTAKQASRRVVVTLSIGPRQIEQWILPVAHDAPPVKNYIKSKWVTLPRERAKAFPRKILTDTCLVRWTLTRRGCGLHGGQTIKEMEKTVSLTITSLQHFDPQTLELEGNMRVVVGYEDKP